MIVHGRLRTIDESVCKRLIMQSMMIIMGKPKAFYERNHRQDGLLDTGHHVYQSMGPFLRNTLYTLLWEGILCCASSVFAQRVPDTIELNNASFEDIPRCCDPPRGWKDCGFPQETPPDVQPSGEFHVNRPAHHGRTYLGMVARDNDTWEMVSQQLNAPLRGDQCYTFKLYLCRNDVYLSPLRRDQDSIYSFTSPIKLRIWGGHFYCDKEQMLAETDIVKHTDWREYTLEFKPTNDYEYILLEAFYKTPTLFPYRGNILIDHASPIIQTSCPGEPALIAQEPEPSSEDEPESKSEVSPSTSPPVTKSDKDTDQETSDENEDEGSSAQPAVTQDDKILKELDRNTIEKGQIIRIDKLYFEADKSQIDSSSHEVLDEMYFFLSKNRDVIVEIGGHTNGLPKDDYCDSLSTARARAVYEYLVGKGISEDRLKYKGYGKRKPLASNKTAYGRKKNQRVEIKILDIQGVHGD